MFVNLLMKCWLYLHDVNVWWQIVAIALSLSTSYFISRLLRSRFPIDTAFSESVAAELVSRLYFPTVLFVLLCIGRLILLAWGNDYLVSLLIPVVGSLTLIRFGIYLSRRIFARSHQINKVHLLIERLFSTGIWILVIFYYTGLLHPLLAFMDQHTLPIGHNKLSLLKISQVLVSIVITVLLAMWASAALDRRLMKIDYINISLRVILSRIGRGLLILCAILVSLDLVGIDLTVLSVFGGALGIGLGLGLQKIASNYVSGFIVLFDRSISVNDLITVDKYTGRVSKISTRYTVLKGLDGVESVIPNELLISSAVQNSSSSEKGIATSTSLTVAYKTDIDSLLPRLIEVIQSLEGVSSNPSPAAFLSNFGKSGLELTIFFWITNPADKGGMVSKVNRAIWKVLQAQNIEIPYPQAEIRVLKWNETSTDHI